MTWRRRKEKKQSGNSNGMLPFAFGDRRRLCCLTKRIAYLIHFQGFGRKLMSAKASKAVSKESTNDPAGFLRRSLIWPNGWKEKNRSAKILCVSMISCRRALREAELNAERRQKKEEEDKALRRRIDEENQSLQLLQQQLQRLCQEAHVQGADELPQAIRCSYDKRDIETKLQECESDLQLQGGMADLQMLCRVVEEAEKEHRDYGLEIKDLEQQLEVKKAALDDLNKQIWAAEEAGRMLRARSGAGESAAELESEYACLRDHLEEYGSLVLASHALNEAIRRYHTGSSTGLLAGGTRAFSAC